VRELGRHDRDADGRADIAHQAEERSGVGPEARLERREGQRRERHEDEPKVEAWTTPETTSGSQSIAGEKPVICQSE
jgi:hypothetical protein